MSPRDEHKESDQPMSEPITWSWYDDEYGDIHPHEALENYVAGGFHPTALNDEFHHGRYIIQRKLGYGGSSTVWLATDTRAGTSSRHHLVSLKIKSASSSQPGLDDDAEIIKLKRLESLYQHTRTGRPRTFVRLLDCFIHSGPNGHHNCLVTELLGPSLNSAIMIYNGNDEVFRPDTVLRSSQQLLEAVDFAHQAGFAHGDISEANVVFTCNVLKAEQDFFDKLSDLYIAKAIKPLPSSSLPKELVQLTVFNTWLDGPEEEIRLIDWGEAFSVENIIDARNLHQPSNLQAPETFFLGHCDYRHDYWRCGCVIYNLLYQDRLFKFAGRPDAHFFICRLMEKLGSLPPSYMPKFEEIRKTCKYAEVNERNINSELIDDTFDIRHKALMKHYEAGDMTGDWDESTHTACKSLTQLSSPLRYLLRYDPQSRITPKGALAMIKWKENRV